MNKDFLFLFITLFAAGHATMPCYASDIKSERSASKQGQKVDLNANLELVRLYKLFVQSIKTKDETGAAQYFADAVDVYATIPSETYTLSEASRRLWRMALLLQADRDDRSCEEELTELNKLAKLYGSKKDTASVLGHQDDCIYPAKYYIERKQYARAEALLAVILEARQTAFGSDDPALLEILDQLAKVYAKTGNKELYTTTVQRALCISKEGKNISYGALSRRIRSMILHFVEFGDYGKSDALIEDLKSAQAKAEIQTREIAGSLRVKPKPARYPLFDTFFIDYYIRTNRAVIAEGLLRESITGIKDKREFERSTIFSAVGDFIYLCKRNEDFDRASTFLDFILSRMKRILGNGHELTVQYTFMWSELLALESKHPEYARQSKHLADKSEKLYESAIGHLKGSKGKQSQEVKQRQVRRLIFMHYPDIASMIFEVEVNRYGIKPRIRDGFLSLDRGDISGAQAESIEAIKVGINKLSLVTLAESLMLQDKSEEAQEALDLCLELSPALENRTVTSVQSGHLRFYSVSQCDARAYALRALLNSRSGKTVEMEKDVLASRKLLSSPYSNEDKITGALNLIAEGSDNAACSELSSVIESEPNNWRAYFYRALSYRRLGDKAKANSDQATMKFIENQGKQVNERTRERENRTT